ncbi:MAG: NADH-quinone oxidoreductase subunit NuoE [Synergistaceae bacterium]|jgi:NADH-quinone oxidoreductase subunit E|nr:NADH-quinone oxidoreductase subunit NuoE [Synergistaceae bacterium]
MALSVDEIRSNTRKIVEPWRDGKGGLIPILQAVQDQMGYLPEEALETISRELKIPSSEIYGVATFYAQFHLSPRGRHVIRVCRGTACHVRGSLKILDSVKEITGVEEHQTTEDLRFTIEPVACIGACGLAPVITIDDQTFGRLTPDMVKGILDKFE